MTRELYVRRGRYQMKELIEPKFQFSLLVAFLFVLAVPVRAERPEDETTCFSPEGHCDRVLVEFVQSAKTSVDIAVYDLKIKDLARALIEKNGTEKVRVLVDQNHISPVEKAKSGKVREDGDRSHNSLDNHSLVQALIRAGIEVRYEPLLGDGIMHDKYTIVDAQMVEVGSYNYTPHAAKYDNDNQVYLSSPRVVKDYEADFEKLWAKGIVLH